MRITYLSVSDQLGGSESVLLEMIRAVRRLRPGWTVHAILPGRGPLFSRLAEAGVEPIALPFPPALAGIGESAGADAGWSVGAWVRLGIQLGAVAAGLPAYERALRRVLLELKPDVLHTNGLKAHVLGIRTAASVPVIWHVHEYISPRPVTRTLLRRYARHAQTLLANSHSVARDLRVSVQPPVPARVLYNAVDLGVFSPEGPRADLDALAGLAPPPRPVIKVGLVAAFGRWKGHDVFLRALAQMPAGTRVRGYVIGAPLYDTAGSQTAYAELKSAARALGVDAGFTGFVSAPEAMRALDVVVHASTQPEPFGLVIAEAMACGRAVITSGLGGAAELVQPDRDALTHTPGDAESLAGAIQRLVDDEGLRTRLGIVARESACRRFTPERFGRDLVDIYEDAGRRARSFGDAGEPRPAAAS